MSFPNVSPAHRTAFIALCIATLAAGLALPMTSVLAGMQNGDGVLTSLISTQRLTWYFWGQDRLLNFLPALAFPFRNPETNLHVQVFLRAAFAFLSPVAVICLFRGSWRYVLVVAVATECILALALTPYGAFNMWVEHNPCGTALVLFGLSAWLFGMERNGPRALAGLTLFLAYAVNIALITWSLPFLAVALAFGIRERRWLVLFSLANCAALLLAWAHSHWVGEPVTTFGVKFSMQAILSGYRSIAGQLSIAIMAVIFVLGLIATALRPSREGGMAILVAVGMVAAVSALSCLSWLQTNEHHIRYFLTFITVFVACCVYAVVRALPPSMTRMPMQAAAALVLGAVMFFVGLRGVSATPFELVDPHWREPARAEARLAIDEHAALIIGDFWDVWPAVMYARSGLRDADQADAPLYGAAFRGHPLRKKMDAIFAAHPEGVLSLCLQATVDDCAKTAKFFGQLKHTVAADAATVRPMTIADKTVFLVVLRRAD